MELWERLPKDLRAAVRSYLHVLTGSLARLVIQALYFSLLVTTLSLSEYGVFASSLAAALIVANGGAFGFTAPLFRAATTRHRLLGWYIGGFYAYVLAGVPIAVLVGLFIYAVVLDGYLSLAAFLAIMLSEALCWRLVDAVEAVNFGLGRYIMGSLAALMGSALRLVGLTLFALFGDGTLDQWALVYLASNASAATLALLIFQPRIRVRWSSSIFLRRLPEAVSYEAGNFVQSLQGEIDKLLILYLSSPATAGLYALSIRIIELVSVPVQSFFALYVKRLMRSRAILRDRMTSLGIEFGIALASLLLFVGLLAMLSLRPHLLGDNVATALPWFSGLLLVPPAKLLLAYHREIFFAANRLPDLVLVSAVLLLFKAPAVAVIALTAGDVDDWVLPLNAVFLAQYLLSAALTWKLIIMSEPKGAARLVLAEATAPLERGGTSGP